MYYAAVLAGGKSSRMGQDKRLLQLDGQTLLERTIKICLDAGADTVLISGDVQGRVTVPDLWPHCGPPGGLYSLLHYLKHHSSRNLLNNTEPAAVAQLLLLPVDMPLLAGSTLRRLQMFAMQTNAACCHYEGEVFPCIFKITTALHDYLKEIFADGTQPGGRRSMKSVMAHLDAVALPLADTGRHEFMNVNTPQDWQEITVLHYKVNPET